MLGLGALLLVLPPLAGIALGMIPFDGQITTDFYVVERFPSPVLWMVLGSLLVLLGLRWKRP
ncbi:hypothetical protein [Deinococcus budaensis]|uniref:Uncharacterized protein n=1 Tax=Deinococcus budaensis TaxID=1665626 RepID=A0A7W8GF04_9DEIO|nr:hypothetical protein [Deinococcus budaensis]MBB5234399.1 hypothetical protein [Deinococcus budaensis]